MSVLKVFNSSTAFTCDILHVMSIAYMTQILRDLRDMSHIYTHILERVPLSDI